MLLHTAHPTHPKPGIAPLTQGKLKTLRPPHSLRGAAHHHQPKLAGQRRGQQRASHSPYLLSQRPDPPGQRGGPPRALPLRKERAPEAGEQSSPLAPPAAWGPGQGRGEGLGSAGLTRSHDFEIPVRTSQSSPGPGPALADGCAPPRGERSPRILARSARSAAAPAAASLPWGSRRTPAASTQIGKRGDTEEGDA